MPAAAQEATGRKMGAEFLGRPARLKISVAVGKTKHAVGIRNVEILRFGSRRIKRDAERFLELVLGEYFS